MLPKRMQKYFLFWNSREITIKEVLVSINHFKSYLKVCNNIFYFENASSNKYIFMRS